MARINTIAYECSTGFRNQTQQAAVRAQHETLEKYIDEDADLKLHRSLLLKRGAGTWLTHSSASEKYSAFRYAILNRIAYVPASAPTVTTCPACKYTCPPSQIISHSLGCAARRGPGPTTRHTHIADAVARAATTNGIICRREYALDEEGKSRMDIVLEMEQQVWLDVTVHSQSAATHPTEASAHAGKIKRYGQIATAANAKLTPFILEANGGIGNDALRAIEMICDEGGPVTKRDLKREVNEITVIEGGEIAKRVWGHIKNRQIRLNIPKYTMAFCPPPPDQLAPVPPPPIPFDQIYWITTPLVRSSLRMIHPNVEMEGRYQKLLAAAQQLNDFDEVAKHAAEHTLKWNIDETHFAPCPGAGVVLNPGFQQKTYTDLYEHLSHLTKDKLEYCQSIANKCCCTATTATVQTCTNQSNVNHAPTLELATATNDQTHHNSETVGVSNVADNRTMTRTESQDDFGGYS